MEIQIVHENSLFVSVSLHEYTDLYMETGCFLPVCVCVVKEMLVQLSAGWLLALPSSWVFWAAFTLLYRIE